MTSAIELPIVLDRAADRTLPVQLAESIRALIAEGRIRGGDTLPATRQLAVQLGVSRGTVVTAYDQLIGEGYLQTSPGSPTRVHPDARVHPGVRPHPGVSARPGSGPPPALRASAPPRRPGAPSGSPAAASPAVIARPEAIDFRPGRPDTRHLQGPTWRAAWRDAAASPSGTRDADPIGADALRTAIVEHLRTLRAVSTTPEAVVVTAGAREGFAVVLSVLSRLRARTLRVGLEQPGYPSLRRVPARLGHTVVPCLADAGGLRVDLLPPDGLDVLVVTPSHQYPLGGSLALGRRVALLDWAESTGTLIVEDDFDSELRYLGAPLPALTSLDADGRHVVLLGTFSALVSPGLASGFLVAPPSMRAALASYRVDLGSPVASVTQQAMARLLSSGFIGRHTRRTRARYRRRRELVQLAFERTRHARLAPMAGGTDAVIRTDAPEDVVVARAEESGLRVGRLSEYWLGAPDSSPGIIIGYAQQEDEVLQRALPLLVEACEIGWP